MASVKRMSHTLKVVFGPDALVAKQWKWIVVVGGGRAISQENGD